MHHLRGRSFVGTRRDVDLPKWFLDNLDLLDLPGHREDSVSLDHLVTEDNQVFPDPKENPGNEVFRVMLTQP